MDLILSRAQLDTILAHARDSAPEECCGLLLGDPATGRVSAVRPTANVAAGRAHRFEIDPQALLQAHKAARAGGPALIGHYHSHPEGLAEPSAADAEMAERRGEFWLIVGRDGAVGAWRAGARGAVQGCFTPVDLKHSPHPSGAS